jgi:hypothetical protein
MRCIDTSEQTFFLYGQWCASSPISSLNLFSAEPSPTLWQEVLRSSARHVCLKL